MNELARLSWTNVRDLDPANCVALLPVGATEAHGPHLPLSTDVLIAQAMAREAASLLEKKAIRSVVLPSLAYSVAEFAAGFTGTVSIRPETASALLADLGASLARQGFRKLAIANAHLDPGHLASLHGGVEAIRVAGGIAVAFPDITRKPWASRLSDEFKSGACHAGQFEGSVIMAERPEWVNESLRKSLPPNPASLSVAIRAGKISFEESGGPDAYFGDPAAATAGEGRETIAALSAILCEAVLAL